MNRTDISVLAEAHREWAKWFVSLVGDARAGHEISAAELGFVEDRGGPIP